MKKTTIRYKIMSANVMMIVTVALFIMIGSNIAVRTYFEKSAKDNFINVLHHLEPIINERAPFAFPRPGRMGEGALQGPPETLDVRFSLMFELEHALRSSLSVIHSNYIILDEELTILNTYQFEFIKSLKEESQSVLEILKPQIDKQSETIEFTYEGRKFIGMIVPLDVDSDIEAKYLILYSPLKWMERLIASMNAIITAIAVVAIGLATLTSAVLSKRIAKPFTHLNQHLRDLANHRYNQSVPIPMDDELKDFAQNINYLSSQLSHSSASQKQFFENISHDLRTPIMSIQSYAEGILYDVTDPKDSAKIIIDEGKRMQKMVEEMLYLSNLQRIEQEPYERISVLGLMESAAQRMQQIAAENKIDLEMKLEGNPSAQMLGSPARLGRAIDNVLLNCIAYAQTKVQIHAYGTQEQFIIEIKDDGPGIDEKELELIFKRYYKGKQGHVGLGLAIAKEISSQHHGAIRAENTETGARFILSFPLAK